MLKARIAQNTAALLNADKESPDNASKWSFDLDWLALDSQDTER